MKKYFAAFAAVLCMALVGCSGDKESSVQDSGNAGIESSVSLDSPESAVPEKSDIFAEAEDNASEQTDTRQEDTYEAQPAAEETEEAPTVNVTEQIAAFDNTYLGLPSADKVYIFSDAEKSEEIDGRICNAVSCFDEYEGTLYYMCDFYISEDSSRVYRYYEQEERFALLPEDSGIQRLDPSKQTVEEIFYNANRLYGLFLFQGDIDVDEYDIIERNGLSYARVADEQLDTKAELLESLDKYFAMDIVNSLMETNRFIDSDGALYYNVSAISGAGTSYRGSIYELTTLIDDTAVFTEYASYVYEAGETEEVEYIYTAKKENGLWRFTEFPWGER